MFASKKAATPTLSDKKNAAHSQALGAISIFRDAVEALNAAALTLDEVADEAHAIAERHRDEAAQAEQARDEHLSTAKALSDLIGGVK